MPVVATIWLSLGTVLVLISIPVAVYRVREYRRDRRAAKYRALRYSDYGVSPDGPFPDIR